MKQAISKINDFNVLVISESEYVRLFFDSMPFNCFGVASHQNAIMALKNSKTDIVIMDYNQEADLLINWIKKINQIDIPIILLIDKLEKESSRLLRLEGIWSMLKPLSFDHTKEVVQSIHFESKSKKDLRNSNIELENLISVIKSDFSSKIDNIYQLTRLITNSGLTDIDRKQINIELSSEVIDTKQNLQKILMKFL